MYIYIYIYIYTRTGGPRGGRAVPPRGEKDFSRNKQTHFIIKHRF